MKTEELTIELTPFKNLSGRLIPGDLIELKLIEVFRLKHTIHSPIDLFTKLILNILFMDTDDHDYHEINIFYSEKNYTHIVLRFLDMLEICLLSKVKPSVVDIVFDRYAENGLRIVAVFKIFYPEDDYVTKETK